MLDAVTLNKVRSAAQLKLTREYTRIASNLVYQRIAKILPSTTLEEHFIGLLESQIIQDFGKDGGGINWSDSILTESVFVNHFLKWGTKMSEAKFTDVMGSGLIPGVNLMSEAVRQATGLSAYSPQALTVGALRQGEGTTLLVDGFDGKEAYTIKCYDGLSLFNAAHPYNFKNIGIGTFSNLLTGTGSASVPGFLPLGGPFVWSSDHWAYSAGAEVSIEDGWTNLWKAIAYIATLRMPDGKRPRYLKPTTLIHSKQLQRNTDRILDAKSIAVKAGSGSTGGGSMDVEGSIKRLGFSDPVILQELDSAPDLAANESYDWYLLCEEDNAASELGAINVMLREPWRVNIYSDASGGGAPQLELGIEDAVAAIGKMRLGAGVGVPQYIFKFKAPRS
jgi:hypothetical protein